MPIPISREVFQGIDAVRLSGATNMLDRPRVIEILEEMGFDEAAEWVRRNKSQYSHGIFQGFEVHESAGQENGEDT